MKQIIEKIKSQMANSIEYGNDLDAASWGMQEGVLISANEARQIVDALEGEAHCIPTREQVIEIMLGWVSHNEPIESTADKILELLSQPAGRAFILPKGEEVNGMLNIALRYLSDEQANALIAGLVKRFVRPDDIKTKMLKDLSAKELEDDVNRNKI